MGIKIGPQKLILKVLNSIKLPNSIPNETGIIQVNSDINSSQQSCITSQPGISTASTLSQPGSNTVNFSTIDPAKFSQYETVREFLLNEKIKQGSKLLKILEDENQLFHENHRRSLVRLVVAELVSFQKSHYPPKPAKRALAQAIITEFPGLKDNYSQTGWIIMNILSIISVLTGKKDSLSGVCNV
ncbi:uncharacterized protein LOC141533749 [Cotesia typhae]|uniref:uncharacterized protein LOC141533749 n=1 Tax=Cotesia typhae TaxID=2053667 RepID=UPI003D681193